MRRLPPRSLLVALALLTVGACAAAAAPGGGAPSTAAPRLTASATAVRPGASLRLRGSGFAAQAHLTLRAGPPHGRTSVIGSAVAGGRGSFVATISVRSRAVPGAFVALACQDACRVKASARFRIVRR